MRVSFFFSFSLLAHPPRPSLYPSFSLLSRALKKRSEKQSRTTGARSWTLSSTLDTMYSGLGPFCGLGNFISWLIECIAPDTRGAVASTAWLAAATSASVARGVPSTRPAERAAVCRKD